MRADHHLNIDSYHVWFVGNRLLDDRECHETAYLRKPRHVIAGKSSKEKGR
jgi:hypothetical protein